MKYIIGVVLSACAFSDAGVEPALPIAPETVNVCGPRCVAFVLEHYKQSPDLVALVEEMQWPHLENGCSLANIRDALESRGIHTSAIRIAENSELAWTEPAIVHLKPSPPFGEHFVVWLPSPDEERINLWDGLNGVRTISQNEFRSQRTGAVLLTSSVPITDVSTAAWYSSPLRPVSFGVVVLVLLQLAALRFKRTPKVVRT